MTGMNLTGVAQFVDALDDLKDTYTASSDGWVVGTNVEYGLYQEFGTYSQPGTPHVRPGVDATRSGLPRIAAQASDLDAFMRLAALQLEEEIKRRAPVDTGNLRASYKAEEL